MTRLPLQTAAIGEPRSATADVPRPHPVVMLRPPYDTLERVVTLQRSMPCPIPGAILGLEVVQPHDDWSVIDKEVDSLRRAAPSCPVIVVLHTDGAECLTLAPHAFRNHVRAVISGRALYRDQLRRSFTPHFALAEDLVEWLEIKGVRLSPHVGALIIDIVRHAPTHRSLTELLGSIGIPETSARFRMQKKRLPAPSRWYQAARALYAAIQIQRHADTCLLRLAHELGYADHSALSQLVYRSFGIRPGVIRGTLGWEWLMDRWVTMQRIRTQRDQSVGTGAIQYSVVGH